MGIFHLKRLKIIQKNFLQLILIQLYLNSLGKACDPPLYMIHFSYYIHFASPLRHRINKFQNLHLNYSIYAIIYTILGTKVEEWKTKKNLI